GNYTLQKLAILEPPKMLTFAHNSRNLRSASLEVITVTNKFYELINIEHLRIMESRIMRL
ncbi:MAG: hypothetical protein WAL71_19545, partial [Terriglobales bacterium]